MMIHLTTTETAFTTFTYMKGFEKMLLKYKQD